MTKREEVLIRRSDLSPVKVSSEHELGAGIFSADTWAAACRAREDELVAALREMAILTEALRQAVRDTTIGDFYEDEEVEEEMARRIAQAAKKLGLEVQG